MPPTEEKVYTVRLTRRQIQALLRAAAEALKGYVEPHDLIALCNGKSELAAMLNAIDNHEPPESPSVAFVRDG